MEPGGGVAWGGGRAWGGIGGGGGGRAGQNKHQKEKKGLALCIHPTPSIYLMLH